MQPERADRAVRSGQESAEAGKEPWQEIQACVEVHSDDWTDVAKREERREILRRVCVLRRLF